MAVWCENRKKIDQPVMFWCHVRGFILDLFAFNFVLIWIFFFEITD